MQQRTQQTHSCDSGVRPECGQCTDVGTARETQQQGFGPVISVMAENDATGFRGRKQLTVGAEAGGTRTFFQIGARGEREPMHRKSMRGRPANSSASRASRSTRRRAKAMVEMDADRWYLNSH